MSEAAVSGHQAISYCPFCAEETLFPLEAGWECRSCLRAFTVRFLGLGSREPVPAPTAAQSTSTGDPR